MSCCLAIPGHYMIWDALIPNWNAIYIQITFIHLMLLSKVAYSVFKVILLVFTLGIKLCLILKQILNMLTKNHFV